MPHRWTCMSPQIPMAKTIKRMKAVYPLKPRCWHLPSLGGSAYFHLACLPPPPSTLAPDPSPETSEVGEEEGRLVCAGFWFSFGELTATTPEVIRSAGVNTAASGFLFGDPFNLAPECPGHAVESEEHPDPLTEIVHHHIENGGRQQVPLVIYGENTTAWVMISDGSRNPN